MTFTPKDSSHVERVDYDGNSGRLSVKFKASKKLYVHGGVPQQVFDNLPRAKSPGEYYHAVIKRYKRV